MPTLHAVGGAVTPTAVPTSTTEMSSPSPQPSLSTGRPCLRSVPAHRIVGGGLGRRYDQAARLSDRHYAGDRQRRPSMAFTPSTSPLPVIRLDSVAPQRDRSSAAAGDVVPGSFVGVNNADERRPNEPMIDGARAVVHHGGHALASEESRNKIGMLTSLCLEAMVNSWETENGNYSYLPKAYHMPHELCARLLRLLVTSRKLTAFTLSGKKQAALEKDNT